MARRRETITTSIRELVRLTRKSADLSGTRRRRRPPPARPMTTCTTTTMMRRLLVTLSVAFFTFLLGGHSSGGGGFCMCFVPSSRSSIGSRNRNRGNNGSAIGGGGGAGGGWWPPRGSSRPGEPSSPRDDNGGGNEKTISSSRSTSSEKESLLQNMEEEEESNEKDKIGKENAAIGGKGGGSGGSLTSTASHMANALRSAGDAMSKPIRIVGRRASQMLRNPRKAAQKQENEEELLERLRTVPVRRVVIVPNSTVLPAGVVQLEAMRSGVLGNPMRQDRMEDLAAALYRWYNRQGYVLHSVMGATLHPDTGTAEISVEEPALYRKPVALTFCKEMVIDPETGVPVTIRDYKQKYADPLTQGRRNGMATTSDLNVTYVVSEGRTSAERIASAMLLQPGEPFRWDSNRWRRVTGSGIFSRVLQASPVPQSDGTVQLHVVVTERSFRHLDYGLSKSLYTGRWEGEVNFEHNNVFGGGEQLGLTVRRGPTDAEPSARIQYKDDKFGAAGGYHVEIFRDFLAKPTSQGDNLRRYFGNKGLSPWNNPFFRKNDDNKQQQKQDRIQAENASFDSKNGKNDKYNNNNSHKKQGVFPASTNEVSSVEVSTAAVGKPTSAAETEKPALATDTARVATDEPPTSHGILPEALASKHEDDDDNDDDDDDDDDIPRSSNSNNSDCNINDPLFHRSGAMIFPSAIQDQLVASEEAAVVSKGRDQSTDSGIASRENNAGGGGCSDVADPLWHRTGVTIRLRDPVRMPAGFGGTAVSASVERTSTNAGRRENIGSATVSLGPLRWPLPRNARSNLDARVTLGSRVATGVGHGRSCGNGSGSSSSSNSFSTFTRPFSNVGLLPYSAVTTTTRQILPLPTGMSATTTSTGHRPWVIALEHSLMASTERLPHHEATARGTASSIRGCSPNELVRSAVKGTAELRVPVSPFQRRRPPEDAAAETPRVVLWGDWVLVCPPTTPPISAPGASDSAAESPSLYRKSAVGLGWRCAVSGIPIQVDLCYSPSEGKVKHSFGLGRDFEV